jgi:hypothetical protein
VNATFKPLRTKTFTDEASTDEISTDETSTDETFTGQRRSNLYTSATQERRNEFTEPGKFGAYAGTDQALTIFSGGASHRWG